MSRNNLNDPDAQCLASTALAQQDFSEPDVGDKRQDLDKLCERWIEWRATRRFFGPSPKIGSILGNICGSRKDLFVGWRRDEICSAELSAFNLAYLCQPEGLGKAVFDSHYIYRISPIKLAAFKIGISRSQYYLLLKKFRYEIYRVHLVILRNNFSKNR